MMVGLGVYFFGVRKVGVCMDVCMRVSVYLGGFVLIFKDGIRIKGFFNFSIYRELVYEKKFGRE